MRLLNLPLALLLAIVSISAVQAEETENSSDTYAQGRAIYNYRCYFCHGYSGDAKTLTASFIDPAPRDFTSTEPGALSRDRMIEVVKYGKPDTAMHGFDRLLDNNEIAAVVDFVRDEFMLNKKINTRYHTVENGWPDHQRYSHAYPFATGEIALDTPAENLEPEQIRGQQLYLTSCISCHDWARVEEEGEIWSKQSISYPRNNYSHTIIDAVSSASIYAQHDLAPAVENLTEDAINGRVLWQQNCAFCHAADGTGQNWIGSFLEPKPRDLSNPEFMQPMTRTLLLQSIRNGLKNTSMPAWKNILTDTQINQIISYINEAFYPGSKRI
jgi:cytochrome c oxidase cbb3-type subunit 3